MAPDVAMIIPYVGPKVKQDDLPSRVSQLVKQKGTFRGIDEASLLAAVQRPQQDVEIDDDESVADDDHVQEDDFETTRANLFKEKFESIQKLG